MFENITKIFKNWKKKENKSTNNSGGTAKERLHLVLMQDRANVSADFLELMKQEIIEVIKKYIDVDESAIDVRLTNKENADGTNGAPALYANIPILNIKNEARKMEASIKEEKKEKENNSNQENNENKSEVKENASKESNKKKKDELKEETLEVKEENVAKEESKNDTTCKEEKKEDKKESKKEDKEENKSKNDEEKSKEENKEKVQEKVLEQK